MASVELSKMGGTDVPPAEPSSDHKAISVKGHGSKAEEDDEEGSPNTMWLAICFFGIMGALGVVCDGCGAGRGVVCAGCGGVRWVAFGVVWRALVSPLACLREGGAGAGGGSSGELVRGRASLRRAVV